jgi:hypothetical protein
VKLPRQKRRDPGELSPAEQALLLELMRTQIPPSPTGFPGAAVKQEPASSKKRSPVLEARSERVNGKQRVVKPDQRRKPRAA